MTNGLYKLERKKKKKKENEKKNRGERGEKIFWISLVSKKLNAGLESSAVALTSSLCFLFFLHFLHHYWLFMQFIYERRVYKCGDYMIIRLEVSALQQTQPYFITL